MDPTPQSAESTAVFAAIEAQNRAFKEFVGRYDARIRAIEKEVGGALRTTDRAPASAGESMKEST
jgi:hypothetical protein